MALAGEGLDEIARIGALDRAGRCKDRDEPGARALGRRLDGRDRTNEGHLGISCTQIGADKREGCVAGDHANFRIMFGKQPAEEPITRSFSAASSQPP